jgi:hypothetical protein
MVSRTAGGGPRRPGMDAGVDVSAGGNLSLAARCGTSSRPWPTASAAVAVAIPISPARMLR